MPISAFLASLRSITALPRRIRNRQQVPIRRERRNPFLTQVYKKEDRTLLSGTGTVDAQSDTVVFEHPGIAVELDVLANDTESTAGSLNIVSFN